MQNDVESLLVLFLLCPVNFYWIENNENLYWNKHGCVFLAQLSRTYANGLADPSWNFFKNRWIFKNCQIHPSNCFFELFELLDSSSPVQMKKIRRGSTGSRKYSRIEIAYLLLPVPGVPPRALGTTWTFPVVLAEWTEPTPDPTRNIGRYLSDRARILDTPCAAGARSTSFHPAVDLRQRSISYVAARHFQNCPIYASTQAWNRDKSQICFSKSLQKVVYLMTQKWPLNRHIPVVNFINGGSLSGSL